MRSRPGRRLRATTGALAAVRRRFTKSSSILSFMKPSCPRTTWPGASGVLETRIGFGSVAVTVVSPLRFASPSTGPFHGHATAAAREPRGTVASSMAASSHLRTSSRRRAICSWPRQRCARTKVSTLSTRPSAPSPMLVCHRAIRNGSPWARLRKKPVFVSAIMGLEFEKSPPRQTAVKNGHPWKRSKGTARAAGRMSSVQKEVACSRHRLPRRHRGVLADLHEAKRRRNQRPVRFGGIGNLYVTMYPDAQFAAQDVELFRLQASRCSAMASSPARVHSA